MKRELTQAQIIERSIIKKFRKELWTPFVKGVKEYELIKEGDKIAVCISGGKDSMLLAKLLQQLRRHSDVPFELVFLVMDPGYNEENMAQVELNSKLLDIPITVFKTDIFDTVAQMDGSPCYICARMRRGHLYKNAQEHGCNKIALGHHFSDVVETTLMGMFYGSQIQAMLPKLHSTNFAGMELIRPLYMVHESGITMWRDYNNLKFIQCACRFTEYCTVDPDSGGSKRQEIKRLLKRLSEENPNLERNIFKSIHNVKLDTLPGYKQAGVEHSFLDNFAEAVQKTFE
ncbi:MAG: tRNA 2-thiocytidine biosynthesis protein TtcA [Oscillospiraceae bacterium]|nr:tRNA 2-thiocytidine biosynthesis protein TtcA [Oscillospiraceae bacterium]